MNQGEGISFGAAVRLVPPSPPPPGESTPAGETAPPSLIRPMPASVAPTLPPVRSRWQKGSLTFGPVGRVLWTAVMLAPPLWFARRVQQDGVLFFADPGLAFSAVFVVTWTAKLVPTALREIWAKEIVHVPQPIASPTRLMTDASGREVTSLAEYVAGQSETPAPHLP